jgi:hypothetical protein
MRLDREPLAMTAKLVESDCSNPRISAGAAVRLPGVVDRSSGP